MVSSTVFPRSLNERIASQALRLAAGSKPVVGSSREDQLRIADQGEREVEPAQLPTGQRPRDRVLLAFEARERDDLVHGSRVGIHCGKVHERLADPDVSVNPSALQDDADPSPQRPRTLPGVEAKYADLTSRTLPIPLQYLHSCGLSCPVWTQETEYFPARNREVDTPDSLEFAVGLT